MLGTLVTLYALGIVGDGSSECSVFTFNGFSDVRYEGVFSEEDELHTKDGWYVFWCDKKQVWGIGKESEKEQNDRGACLAGAIWAGGTVFEPAKYDVNWHEVVGSTWVRRNISIICVRTEVVVNIAVEPVLDPSHVVYKSIVNDILVQPIAQNSSERTVYPTFASPYTLVLEYFPQIVLHPASIVSTLPASFGDYVLRYSASVTYRPDLPATTSPTIVSTPVPSPTALPSSDDEVKFLIPVIVTGCGILLFLVILRCIAKSIELKHEREMRKMKAAVISVDDHPCPMEIIDTKQEIGMLSLSSMCSEKEATASGQAEGLSPCPSSYSDESSISELVSCTPEDICLQASITGHTIPKTLSVRSRLFPMTTFELKEQGVGDENSSWESDSGTVITSTLDGRWSIAGVLLSKEPHYSGLPHTIKMWTNKDRSEEDVVAFDLTWSTAPSKLWVVVPLLPEVDSVYKYRSELRGHPIWQGNSWTIYTDDNGHWKIGDLISGAGYVKSISPHNGKEPHEIEHWCRAPIKSGEANWMEDADIQVSAVKIRKKRKALQVSLWVDCESPSLQHVNSKYTSTKQEGEGEWICINEKYKIIDDEGKWCLCDSDGTPILRTVEPHNGAAPTHSKQWSSKGPDFTVSDKSIHVGKTTRPLVSIASQELQKYTLTCTIEAYSNINGCYIRSGKHNRQPLWVKGAVSIFSDASGHWKVGSYEEGTGVLKSAAKHESALPHTVAEWMRSPLEESETTWVVLDKDVIKIEE